MSEEKKPEASDFPEIRRIRLPSPAVTHDRGTRRRAISGVLVAIDAPSVSDQPWVVDAVDINGGGMGLVLPDSLVPGTEVELSFKLDEDTAFSRVAAVVEHQEGSVGGVSFGEWSSDERLRLLEYLVRVYEAELGRD